MEKLPEPLSFSYMHNDGSSMFTLQALQLRVFAARLYIEVQGGPSTSTKVDLRSWPALECSLTEDTTLPSDFLKIDHGPLVLRAIHFGAPLANLLPEFLVSVFEYQQIGDALDRVIAAHAISYGIEDKFIEHRDNRILDPLEEERFYSELGSTFAPQWQKLLARGLEL